MTVRDPSSPPARGARKNVCFFDMTSYLKQMQVLAGKRVRIKRRGIEQVRVGFLSQVIDESLNYVALHSTLQNSRTTANAQSVTIIPLSEIEGDISIDPPQFVTLPGSGQGLWMPTGEMISTHGDGRFVSVPDAHGQPMAARVLAINPMTNEVTLQIPYEESVGSLVFYEPTITTAQLAQLRISKISKDYFEAYERNLTLRRSTPPAARESWPDVTTTAVANDVAQAYIEARRVFDPAAALGSSGIHALYELIRSPLPNPNLAPDFATPGLTARSLSLRELEQTRNEDGTLFTMGFIAHHALMNLPDDHWFRATLNSNTLEEKEYRPKVYIPLPIERLAELLPMITTKAAKFGCHQLKFGSTWNDLIRDDRMVLHFNNLESSVRFAKELDLILVGLDIQGPSAAFTYRVGQSPVSIGFDPPWGESWRYYVSRRVRDVLKAGATDVQSFTDGLLSHGIVAGHWVPTSIHQRFLRAFSAH